ncbi:dihydrolipoyl dehydrogenase [Candidatus Marinamargulisbacteria bacterium SCGC AG-410-N11]|nr:dihydrolipoyl dehydrogenase [Candidatus Marinamargulisbacteria bacterium SCGC AG-410-N11]
MLTRIKTDIVVLGAGPGGYAAAFYAADMGRDVLLVEMDNLGGVCLNRGCIPSKALIHATNVIDDAKDASQFGVQFEKPKVDLDKLRKWKDKIIKNLSAGIGGLAKKRDVQVLKGRGYFEGEKILRVETDKGQKFIDFEYAIIAVGSSPAIPAAFDLGNKRIMTSTEALDIEEIPKKFLVVGGGYIGMELGLVYASLGSQVHLVEAAKSILAGADSDLVKPVLSHAEKIFKSVRLNTKVAKMATKGKQIEVSIEDANNKTVELYDKVLIATGRTPNSNNLGLKDIGVQLNDQGYIKVNDHQQTTVDHIYAIGDIAGGILLAHKASKEAKVAVEVICGKNATAKFSTLPAVVFTHPEVAWCGLTEQEAREKNLNVKVAKFPWVASGRALTLNKQSGLTKLIIEPETDRLLGVGIVGHHAGELIAEATLAVDLGITAEDLALTIHPHPTLSETIMESAEVFYGHSSHMYSPSGSDKKQPEYA